jgi:hypothetical protein
VEFLGKKATVDDLELNPLERAAYETKTMYRQYEESDPTFDTTNLLAETKHLPCPPIDDELLTKFTNFANEDKWGRRKAPPLVIPIVVSELLQAALAESGSESKINIVPANSGHRDNRQPLAIDIVGPGGGQWTLYFSDNRLVDVAMGLPPESSSIPILRISAAELVEAAQSKGRAGSSSASLGNGHASTADRFDRLYQCLAAGMVATTAEE